MVSKNALNIVSLPYFRLGTVVLLPVFSMRYAVIE
jgi:hypothetical protein